MQNDFILELDAFNPRWQATYRTIALAAKAAGVLPMYADWLKTSQGRLYASTMAGVADTVAQNEAERKLRERARDLT